MKRLILILLLLLCTANIAYAKSNEFKDKSKYTLVHENYDNSSDLYIRADESKRPLDIDNKKTVEIILVPKDDTYYDKIVYTFLVDYSNDTFGTSKITKFRSSPRQINKQRNDAIKQQKQHLDQLEKNIMSRSGADQAGLKKLGWNKKAQLKEFITKLDKKIQEDKGQETLEYKTIRYYPVSHFNIIALTYETTKPDVN